ncbi:hypothetical protein ANO11243_078640 [Dothideomycetidae sp. 11243]|nr:hypothetical protein ANO11243_078640 [fungal sp. No.11243]
MDRKESKTETRGQQRINEKMGLQLLMAGAEGEAVEDDGRESNVEEDRDDVEVMMVARDGDPGKNRQELAWSFLSHTNARTHMPETPAPPASNTQRRQSVKNPRSAASRHWRHTRPCRPRPDNGTPHCLATHRV